MPRHARITPKGYVYHVLNRAAGRITMFRRDPDFAAFERVMLETHDRVPLRILSWCVMSNHWHFVVRLTGKFAGRELQQPFNRRHAQGMSEVVELLPGVDEQFHDRQELLVVPGEEFDDLPQAGRWIAPPVKNK